MKEKVVHNSAPIHMRKIDLQKVSYYLQDYSLRLLIIYVDASRLSIRCFNCVQAAVPVREGLLLNCSGRESRSDLG